MSAPRRSVAQRISDVHGLLRAAQEVYTNRNLLVDDIADASGLSREGVELGFASLERDASEADLAALANAAGDASHVHVVLSANVFVGALRALALARSASPRVTVRPSSRDPVLARALVEAARDDSIALVEERDVAAIDAGEIHVYGTSDTIAKVRARARVIVRGHGPGMGIAVVTATARKKSAAASLASDVVPFDQRGCLSPRVVFVEGDAERAFAFAVALHEALLEWSERAPRGALSPAERSEAATWADAAAFAGHVLRGESHAVAIGDDRAVPLPGPAGRHVFVVAAPTLEDAFARAAIFAPFVVAVGSDDPVRIASFAPAHARTSFLGRMQHPPLDGPVDRRQSTALRSPH